MTTPRTTATRTATRLDMSAADRLRSLALSVVMTVSMLAGVQVLATSGAHANPGAELAQTTPAARL